MRSFQQTWAGVSKRLMPLDAFHGCFTACAIRMQQSTPKSQFPSPVSGRVALQKLLEIERADHGPIFDAATSSELVSRTHAAPNMLRNATSSSVEPHEQFEVLSNTTNVTPAKIAQSINPLLEGPKFAICGIHNMQYRISVGDVFIVQRIRAELGETLAFKQVAMVGGPHFTAIGRPFLSNVRVLATVEEHKRMRNIIYTCMPRRRKVIAWRDNQHHATTLRCIAIEFDAQIVSEIDKYTGALIPPSKFDPIQSPNRTYWADSTENLRSSKEGHAYPPGVEKELVVPKKP